MSYKITDPAEMIVHDSAGVTHPGSMIRDQIEERGLSIEDAAEKIGMSASSLHAVLDGNAPVTVDTADRLEILFGDEFADLVYRWQQQHDQGV
jgi:HTH-type transcriptional regulator / antitoxin HigA